LSNANDLTLAISSRYNPPFTRIPLHIALVRPIRTVTGVAITVKLRQTQSRPQLRWETVHKYLEQMVQEQMIFRYEDPFGIVTYSKNPIVREKVLF
jgi:hypothetical protein